MHDPDVAGELLREGSAQLESGRPVEAVIAFCRAVQLAPRNAAAYFQLGNGLRALNRTSDAAVAYGAAVSLEPTPWAYLRLGNTLLDLGRLDEAVGSFQRASSLNPQYVEAHNNLGNAFRLLGRAAEALQCYDACVGLQPAFAVGWFNRGLALHDLQRPEDALDSYERALVLQPDFAQALNNRGMVQVALGQREQALESFNRALTVAPNYAAALSNRGELAWQFKRFDHAVECFSRLLVVAPESDYALGNLLYSRLHCCDWSQYAADVARLSQQVAEGRRTIAPFPSLAIDIPAASQLQIARAYVADRYPTVQPALCAGERYRHDKIRIAYLSADFHDHATSYLMAELFELHDRDRFELTAVSFGPSREDGMRQRLRAAFPRFVEVGQQSDRTVAGQLRSWEIDIVVDLKGFTEGSRPGILAHRPAPIQVAYLGYPGSMGADYVDYVLADRHVIPAADAGHYCEKIVCLPDCYQVNDSKRPTGGRTPARAELHLPEAAFVFCCFNNSFKISPPVFDVWMRLLAGVAGSVLWLFEDHPVAASGLRKAALARDIHPDRLVFAARQPLEAHLARHRQADLFLDTLPYNAHTTASDALWAGLPVLTCTGSTFAGRVATSLLYALGVPELVTASLQQYETLALDLALNPTKLAALREKIARNRLAAPLFDTPRFRRHLESAYVTMWGRYECGASPVSFTVESER